MKKDINLPTDVCYLIDRLNSYGHKAVIVGGCVRDALMGFEPKDWDLATSATPAQVKSIFPKTFDTGIKHGTVTVVHHKINYEITTFRTEGSYRDHRHPDTVSYTTSLREDLNRRDFTMNAIAYHPVGGWSDPFHGMEDIKNCVIRGVGRPEERFHEDALRMLRALRFTGQLGFIIEDSTWKALQMKSTTIVHVSAERVREEFLKLLLSNGPDKLELVNKSKLMVYYHPVFGNILKEREGLFPYLRLCPRSAALRLSFLLEPLTGGEAEKLLQDFRFDNKTIKMVTMLIQALKYPADTRPAGIRKQASRMGREAYEKFMILSRVKAQIRGNGLAQINEWEEAYRQVISDKPCLSLKELALSGKDLISLGCRPGPELGLVLENLLEAVLETPKINTREDLLKLIKK